MKVFFIQSCVLQLNNSWKSVPDSEKLYLETLKTVEPTHHVIILASALSDRLSAANNAPLFDGYIVSYNKQKYNENLKPFFFCRAIFWTYS